MEGRLTVRQEERRFPPEGVPLVTASAALPRRTGPGQERFNRYYEAYGRAFFAYCGDYLLPLARETLASGGGTVPDWRVTLRTHLTLQRGGVASLYTDTVEDRGGRRLLLRRGDTWDLPGGALLTLGELLPGGRRTALRAVAQQLRRRAEERLVPEWRRRLRPAFAASRFYLTEQGLCVFFQPGVLTPAGEGAAVFTIPWGGERGPRLPPELTEGEYV